MHPESHSWPHLGRARQEARPPGWRRNGRAIPVLPTTPLSPCLPGHPAGLCLTAGARPWKKLTACFCLTARELQAAETGAGGGPGAGGLLLIRMDFSASLLVGRAGTGYGRLLKE